MKTVAIIDEGFCAADHYKTLLQQAKQHSNADNLIVLISGDFSHSGLPAAESKLDRTEKFLSAGADMVLELPLFSVLLRRDIYEFALASVLQRTGCVDELVLPYEAGTEPLLKQIADYLFREPIKFQNEVKQLQIKGMDTDSKIPAIVEKDIPGAERFLQRDANRFAVELSNALRKCYSSVKACLLPVEAEQSRDAAISCPTDKSLALKTKTLLSEVPESNLMEIFGATTTLLNLLNSLPSEAFSDGFCALSKRAATKRYTPEAIRYFLLRALSGFRKIDHSLYALYSYVPYLRILDCKSEELTERITEKAWVPILTDTNSETEKLDESRWNLLRMEAKLS